MSSSDPSLAHFERTAFSTDRLTVAPLTAEDVPEFVAYRQDPAVARFQSWSTNYSDADAQRLVDAQRDGTAPSPGSWLQLALKTRSATGSGALLGDLALHRLEDQPDTFEIGVTLASKSQGHGYGAEAVIALVHFVFDRLKARRIIASCDARNANVARLLRRAGFRHESSQLEAELFKGELITLDGYALLAREPRVGQVASKANVGEDLTGNA